jgi:hypothetical protein
MGVSVFSIYEALNTINSKKNLHQNWIQNKNSTPSNYANFLRSDSTRYLFRNKISKLFIAHHSITYNDDHFSAKKPNNIKIG